MHLVRDIFSKRTAVGRSQGGQVGDQVGASQLQTEPTAAQIQVNQARLSLGSTEARDTPYARTRRRVSQLVAKSTKCAPLPTEPWIHILSYLDGRKDLRALTRTSKLLRVLSLKAMWSTVDWSSEKRDPLQLPLRSGFRNPLQYPDVAVTVTNLRVLLTSPGNECNDYDSRDPLTCTCSELDGIVGECLLAMVNLKVLLFTCRLSCDNPQPRHRYLHTVQCKDILTAPCCATVEALHWNAPANYIGLGERHMQSVPNLRTLHYQGKLLDPHLLATRPIERICISGVTVPNEGLSQALVSTPGKFTHFSISDISWLALLLPIKPSLFKNLQHVGTVPAYNKAVESLLSPFKSLRRLVSLDVVWIGDRSTEEWDAILLTRVKLILPGVATVLCHRIPMSVIWEFKADTWWRRDVPSFAAWDVISGVLDNEGGPIFSRLGQIIP